MNQKNKKTAFIPEGSNPLQEKFINYIMKRGKKSTARQIMKDTFNILKKKGFNHPEKILEKAIDNSKPLLEVRPKRIGGAVYQIPIEVPYKRQIILSFRWILNGAREKKGKMVAEKLALELEEASNGTGSAIKKKEDSHKMAQANRAFAHYAKY